MWPEIISLFLASKYGNKCGGGTGEDASLAVSLGSKA